MHTDQINTPRIISRPSDNKLRWRWDQTSPSGAGAATENPASLGTFTYNLRFPGQVIMSETGNKQNWFRDYESFTGRYLQSDPIGLEAGVNTYSYVGGSPIMNRDPLGTDALFIHYVGYPVALPGGVSLPLGHSGVVAIDPATGKAVYYEFGRYGGKCGNVRGPFDVGTIAFDAKGTATKASIDAVLQRASGAYGKNSPVYYEYSKKPYDDVLQYAEQRKAEADSCQRPYNFPFDTCNNFAREAADR